MDSTKSIDVGMRRYNLLHRCLKPINRLLKKLLYDSLFVYNSSLNKTDHKVCPATFRLVVEVATVGFNNIFG